MGEPQIVNEGTETVPMRPLGATTDGTEVVQVNFGTEPQSIAGALRVNVNLPRQEPVTVSGGSAFPKAATSPFFTDLAKARAEMG